MPQDNEGANKGRRGLFRVAAVIGIKLKQSGTEYDNTTPVAGEQAIQIHRTSGEVYNTLTMPQNAFTSLVDVYLNSPNRENPITLTPERDPKAPNVDQGYINEYISKEPDAAPSHLGAYKITNDTVKLIYPKKSIIDTAMAQMAADQSQKIVDSGKLVKRRSVLKRGLKAGVAAAVTGDVLEGLVKTFYGGDLVHMLDNYILGAPPYKSNPDSKNLVISLFNSNDIYNLRIDSIVQALAGGNACVMQPVINKDDPASAVEQISHMIEEHIAKVGRLDNLIITGHGSHDSISFANPKGYIEAFGDAPKAPNKSYTDNPKDEYYADTINPFVILNEVSKLKDKINAAEKVESEKPICSHLTIDACQLASYLSPDEEEAYKQFTRPDKISLHQKYKTIDAKDGLNCIISVPFDLTENMFGLYEHGDFADFIPDKTAPDGVVVRSRSLQSPLAYQIDQWLVPSNIPNDTPSEGAWISKANSTSSGTGKKGR